MAARNPGQWSTAGLGAVLLVALVALTVAVKMHPSPWPVDVSLELDVQHLLLPVAVAAVPIEAVSTLNFPLPVAVTLLIVTIVMALLRRWLDILAVLATVCVADGTRWLLMEYVRRPRPSGHGLHIIQTVSDSFSFPSGHVTYAVAVYGLFLYLTYQVRRPVHAAIRWGVRILTPAVILLMPLSRVLEAGHWPSDVLGGLLFGSFWLLVAIYLYPRARFRWPRLLAADER